MNASGPKECDVESGVDVDTEVAAESPPEKASSNVEMDTFSQSDDDELNSASTHTDSDSDAGCPPAEDPSDLVVQGASLKEEGNLFFKTGDLVKASRSYRKGTSMLKKLNTNNTGDDQVKALLLSLQNNLSMVCFKQGKTKVSRDVASSALSVESANVKALYRRAAANRKLGNLDEARHDLKEALKHDPQNSSVKKELMAVKREMDFATQREKKRLQKAFSSKSGSFLYDDKEQEKRMKEEKRRKAEEDEKEAVKQRKVEWEDECVKRMSNAQPVISFEDWEKERKARAEETQRQAEEEEKRLKEERRKAQAKARQSMPVVNDESDEDDDELTENERAMLRGYKKTSDGRTTSYFTRELSAHEKNMLGDTAPKRLAESLTTTIAAEATRAGTANPVASAWNQAGTWEEKDTTEWCTSHLRSKLKSSTAQYGAYVAVVTAVKELSGDASVALTGGKKRYIFDFHCSLDYEIRDSDDEEVLSSGSLNIPDICSTSHDELEVNVSTWKNAPHSEHEAGARTCRDALANRVRSSVQGFVADFNVHY